VALGAAVVEKHITLSRDLPGPDHRASIEPDVFRAMVNRIRAVESTLGSGEKVPVAGEAEVAAVARKSLHWATGLPAGAIVEAGHLAALRPGTGISPAQTASLVGHALARSVVRGRMVEMQDVERKP
jgi:sialic acid synthase SpsE